MSNGKFSVLMTTYNGEQESYLDASLNSVLVEQSRCPDQLVLVVDGPIREELNQVIEKYVTMLPGVVEVVYLSENVGQSKASVAGFELIKYDIFARMDSDDICVSSRFAKQTKILEDNADIDVVGGWIAEFDNDPDNVSTLRVVPESHDDIADMFKVRMPLNNVTVMMRKDAVTRAGGYGRETVNEDYSLYAHMWVNGATFYNIQEVLCKVRVGNDMVGRRQDFRIYRDWKKDQKYLLENGKHTRWSYFCSNFRCFGFIVTPKWIKKILYKTILRKKQK